MDYSTRISERMWNQPDKGELEAERENTFIDDIVQKAHIEKELLSNLDGIETVFDGGAGCGRFSILLAKQGLRVTHFDISRPMIDKARELVEKERVLDRITFVQGALEDLSAYADKSFDLVISTIITALIWWLWHLPLFFISGASQYKKDFFVFGIMVLGFSFMLGVIRKLTGSVWLCVLCHGIVNSVGNFYHYDMYGSYLAASVTTAVMILVSLTLIFVFRDKNIFSDNKTRK